MTRRLIARVAVVAAAVCAGVAHGRVMTAAAQGRMPDQTRTVDAWLRLGVAHAAGQDDAAIAALRQWTRPEVLDVVHSQELNQPSRLNLPFAIRRGLLLHLDVAVLSRSDDGYRLPPGGLAFRLIGDGESIGNMQGTFHWAIGRDLLTKLPRGRERTELTRDWYRATTAFLLEWGEAPEIDLQLATARAEDPDDSELLLDECTLHQAYASPLMQQYLATPESSPTSRPVVNNRPASGSLGRAGLRDDELKAAEACLRAVIKRDPATAEAHVRLAHVLVATGRAQESVDVLSQPAARTSSAFLQYYAALIEGRARTALRQTAGARAAFERAFALSPRAISPRIGLSRAALMDGDVSGATALLTYLTSLRAGETDPFWRYYRHREPDAMTLIAQLRERLAR